MNYLVSNSQLNEYEINKLSHIDAITYVSMIKEIVDLHQIIGH